MSLRHAIPFLVGHTFFMIKETITDESDTELSIHFNSKDELVLTIDSCDMRFQVITLTKEDAEWMIKRLKKCINEMD